MEFNEVPPAVAQYAPFTDPADATFPAYRVFAYGPHVLSRQKGQVMSGALMRAVLLNVTRDNDGSMSQDEVTGALAYRYPDLPDVFVAHPDPDPHLPLCAKCGQWESEHANPNGTACDAFTVLPAGHRDTAECSDCRQPRLHHGGRYTVACKGFIDA
ncbi:hypothetical protein ACIQ9R_36195 [Streptomyces sp. NPDC094447]|uniref:hypothetical protein n=1 Tax=Streptomyces sp. NPDC094447 TaxID=3366062 RepID=UPI0038125E8A